MRILITGGGGLIGQAIARKHLSEGDEVFIYDTRVNKYNDYSNLVGNDVTDYVEKWGFKSLIDNEDKYKFDVISNQAALVGVGQSQYDIDRYIKNNIGATSELVQAILDTKKFPKKILHAGSMGPYGEGNPKGPTHELIPFHPESIYAVSKEAQEEIIRVFAETYEVPTISLRYFSVYSTDQTPLNPYTGVLSIIANQCLNSEKIEIYENGSQARDLIHVNDVANAHFIASRKTFGSYFIGMNIATGEMTQMAYVAERIRDILSPGKEIVYNGKHRKGDIHHIVADINLSTVLLEWIPEISIDQGIDEYCDFILKNREKFTIDSNTVAIENENVEEKGLVK